MSYCNNAFNYLKLSLSSLHVDTTSHPHAGIVAWHWPEQQCRRLNIIIFNIKSIMFFKIQRNQTPKWSLIASTRSAFLVPHLIPACLTNSFNTGTVSLESCKENKQKKQYMYLHWTWLCPQKITKESQGLHNHSILFIYMLQVKIKFSTLNFFKLGWFPPGPNNELGLEDKGHWVKKF